LIWLSLPLLAVKEEEIEENPRALGKTYNRDFNNCIRSIKSFLRSYRRKLWKMEKDYGGIVKSIIKRKFRLTSHYYFDIS